MRHVLQVAESEKGRLKALSRVSRQKRRETWTTYREEDREAVLLLYQQGLVPLAIGPSLSMPDSTVAKHLRELEREGRIELPSYLSLGG